MPSRRSKILYATPEAITALLFNANQHDQIRLPKIQNPPDDLEVGEVHYFFDRHLFGIKLTSSTFDEVPLGEILPTMDCEWGETLIFKNEKTVNEKKREIYF